MIFGMRRLKTTDDVQLSAVRSHTGLLRQLTYLQESSVSALNTLKRASLRTGGW